MAYIGYGSLLYYETTPGSGTYTAVAEVQDIEPWQSSVGEVDTTHMLSTNTAKQFIPGLFEGGEATFKCLWAKAQNNSLYNLLRSNRKWRITYPDPTSSLTFSGFITKFETEMGIEDAVVTNITFVMSSAA